MSARVRSLITGGAGFIASHVARHCLALGHEVVVLDDLSGGFADQVPEAACFVKSSVLDSVLVRRLFEEYRFHYVYHLAAYAAEGLSHFIRRFNYDTNLIGSVNLINEAVKHNVKCFVFASSIAVYGHNQLPMDESMTPQPEDPYGISKYAVELDLRAAYKMFGLSYIIFRPHNVYGEHQNIGDPYRNVIGIFMNQIFQGRPLTIFGDGLQTRAFSYIDDVAPAIARSVHVPAAYNEVINIGADEPHTIKHVAETVAKALGAAPEFEFFPPRNEVEHAFSNHEKARRILGTAAAIRLEEGVARMAAWVRRTGIRASAPFENIEVRKNMPPSWERLD
ncbi:MAG: NAD-dependent epimerase/dehydratase family protein [Acidobacteria bacterium]|nr:NAD-dependent epimerase/dehydratase family protein [Acidobacteriota bacterium]